ncbi:hypothetical protein C8R47DRAFT_1100937 [Mycena vitilis]|nr:hypothetical protein C8R47DRAFT_1100937 [Mycena vitilis]
MAANEAQTSVPDVGPSEYTIERFWKRVAEVTTRYHDEHQRWRGGEEIARWNDMNQKPCERCANSKVKRDCVVDQEHPACRACRNNKVSCDRKPKFIFDMTKDVFFPSYLQFLDIYHNRKPGQMRRLRRHEYRFKPVKVRIANGREILHEGNPPSENGSPESIARIEQMQAALDTANGHLRALGKMCSQMFSEQSEMQYRLRASVSGLRAVQPMIQSVRAQLHAAKRAGKEEAAQMFNNAFHILDQADRHFDDSPASQYTPNSPPLQYNFNLTGS